MTAAERARGGFATRFDAAFASIAGAAPRSGWMDVRTGFSQFNIMINGVLHLRPEAYAFHATPYRNRGVALGTDPQQAQRGLSACGAPTPRRPPTRLLGSP